MHKATKIPATKDIYENHVCIVIAAWISNTVSKPSLTSAKNTSPKILFCMFVREPSACCVKCLMVSLIDERCDERRAILFCESSQDAHPGSVDVSFASHKKYMRYDHLVSW